MDVKNPVIVWLDVRINDSSNQSIANIIKTKYPNTLLQEGSDLNETIRFIQRITSKEISVIVIVSGHLGEELTKQIHDNPHVLSINVFCGNKARAEMWGNHFRKVRMIMIICIKYKYSAFRVLYNIIG